jgi:uracil-DNA glycosylase family 4
MDNRIIRKLTQSIGHCDLCPRLRTHCTEIAKTKRKSFQNEVYWGKPIAGFGDPKAQLIIVGLAPAAHGANRTGRIFTGDRSGDWLYRALHKVSFANQPTSTFLDDGLQLSNCFITCSVKCAPPDNKPTPEELKTCQRYLIQELEALNSARVYLALGQIGFLSLWNTLSTMKRIPPRTTRPRFAHGKQFQVNSDQWILLSYHPSQQNTFTGKLTEPMFDRVFDASLSLLS